jgi:hypothetical protein
MPSGAYHLAIAKAFAESDDPDADAAFEHFLEAGDDSSAREYVLRAAEGAGRALAFLRAASLYRAAITLRAGPSDVLYTRLGDALANAGRGADAADAYMEAAASARPIKPAAGSRQEKLKSGVDERGLESLGGARRGRPAYPVRRRRRSRRPSGTRRGNARVAQFRRIHESTESGACEAHANDAAFTAPRELGDRPASKRRLCVARPIAAALRPANRCAPGAPWRSRR